LRFTSAVARSSHARRKPREGVVRLSEADVDSGDVVRRDVLRPRAVTDELLEHSPRFGPPAREPIDAAERTPDPTGAGPERLRRLELCDLPPRTCLSPRRPGPARGARSGGWGSTPAPFGTARSPGRTDGPGDNARRGG
jgi:hypothetical protein